MFSPLIKLGQAECGDSNRNILSFKCIKFNNYQHYVSLSKQMKMSVFEFTVFFKLNDKWTCVLGIKV